MTLTSFRGASRHVSVATWRRLHKTGVYVIWLRATYIYQSFARAGHDIFDVTAVGILLLAGGIRAAAWSQARLARPLAGQQTSYLQRLAHRRERELR